MLYQFFAPTVVSILSPNIQTSTIALLLLDTTLDPILHLLHTIEYTLPKPFAHTRCYPLRISFCIHTIPTLPHNPCLILLRLPANLRNFTSDVTVFLTDSVTTVVFGSCMCLQTGNIHEMVQV
jgi:hypothetical protein